MKIPQLALACLIAIGCLATWSLPQAVAEKLQIASRSSKIHFVGSKPAGRHTGGFQTFTGSFDPDAGQLSLNIDMRSLFTDDRKLTRHLMSPDFFDVRKFPTATFVASQIREEQNEGATHVIVGKLTLHGVTRQLTIPCQMTWQGKSLLTSGKVTLSRSEFGISYGQGQIHEQVPVTFHLVATPAADGSP
ncbi:MAG: hypothetical protein GTO03_13285 [Planctomycetales bacterium]|nr:hypothetical protein [Planctomycetales bacterium]